MFATLRPYEQIRNSIAAQNLNVRIAATHAGVSVGEDGLAHQAIEDVAILRSLPNMNIFVPADAVAAKAVVKASTEMQGPVYIRMSRAKSPVLYGDDYEFYPGKADILRDSIEARVAIIAMGLTVFEALKAAEELEKDGIPTIVADFSSVKPINRELLVNIARRSKLVVTLEEHNIIGGLGSAVCEVLSEEYPHVPVCRFGVNDVFGESGSPDALFQHFGLNAGYVYRNILKLLS
jgi:transketolase